MFLFTKYENIVLKKGFYAYYSKDKKHYKKSLRKELNKESKILKSPPTEDEKDEVYTTIVDDHCLCDIFTDMSWYFGVYTEKYSRELLELYLRNTESKYSKIYFHNWEVVFARSYLKGWYTAVNNCIAWIYSYIKHRPNTFLQKDRGNISRVLSNIGEYLNNLEKLYEHGWIREIFDENDDLLGIEFPNVGLVEDAIEGFFDENFMERCVEKFNMSEHIDSFFIWLLDEHTENYKDILASIPRLKKIPDS